MRVGIILAAGASCRMGQLKQLLPLARRPMVWHVANAACRSMLDRVILVTGAGAELIRPNIQELAVTIVHNKNWEIGQSSSLIAGLNVLPPETEAVLFLLADQPLISSVLINSILTAYPYSGKSIIVPEYAGQWGPPVLFGWEKWKDGLTALSGDQGARKIIENHPEDVHLVPQKSAEFLWDVDTAEDYRHLAALMSARLTSKQESQ